MFPRIFFIFFLVISSSIGSEIEGPSETECRPYIEKALHQREGVTQEPGQTIDDVGEPPQIDETIDGSKDDTTNGEEASGSVENQQDSGGSNSSEGEVTLEEASSEIIGEALFQEDQPIGEEDPLESSGEPLSGDSVESVENTASEELGVSDEVRFPEPLSPKEEDSNENTAEESETQTAELSAERQEASVNSEGAGESQEASSVEELSAQSPDGPNKEDVISKEQELADGSEQSDELKDDASEQISNNEEQEVSEESTELPPAKLDQEETVEETSEEVVPVESESIESTEANSTETEKIEDQSSDEISRETGGEPASLEQGRATNEEASVSAEGEGDPIEEPSFKIISTEPELAISEEGAGSASSAESVEINTVPADEKPASVDPESVSSNESVITSDKVVETESIAPVEAAPEAKQASGESTEPKSEPESQKEGETSPTIEEESSQSVENETESETALPEEELIMPIEIPSNLRTRDHMAQILKLQPGADEKEKLLGKTIDNTLRDLKKLYDVAIKPLEILYKYRDLSNRHYGDPEIFSKPLILFMGPWSGGKSTIINYLLENEFKKTALRSGAEPSPAYFNIVMHGESEEILDGTQLAADWTFSGLQKFGQGLLDRLRGLRLNHPLLRKVNIVEIPGILEIRKQVERLFPFNDACQWFIDRADIIFLVYDPSKLDVGPETEAILDQLKGREMQTRIVLNKADQVKPEELMRVQGTLIWNISPLMSSTEPPVMYSTSLWSLPYEVGAPARLLYAQECSFLKDLREAIDKRVENKIASARRFAVRVRNHAKMVDCYLTTYYNHKSFFGNKKKVSDDIIEHPQNYHIYEGLSTLTNISRYDLPDPDVYKDFFRLNPVYEFQQLSATCTYFRGCPINRLDVAIAYDLPDLVGKYKKSVDEVLNSRK